VRQPIGVVDMRHYHAPEAELIAKTDAEHLRAAIAALPTPIARDAGAA